MPQFDKRHMKELQEFLYYSCDHDANIKSINYEYGENRLKIDAFNPIFNVQLDLTFCDIELVLVIKGKWPGNRETMIGLFAKEDFSYLQNYLLNHKEGMEDALDFVIQTFSGDKLHMENALYFLIQTLSGDELHIVCREVIFEKGVM